MSPLERTSQVALGEWITPRLGGAFGAAGRTVPRGFAAYARIFHPVDAHDGVTPPQSWAEVRRATGAIWHPTMQWHNIAATWQRGAPRTGSLDDAALSALAAILGDTSGGAVTGADPVTVGLWVGYGDTAFPAPTLDLPGREYALFRVPVGELGRVRWPGSHALNLAWPNDHSWFVASEIDFDSTLVGGSRDLVDRLLASELEAAEITVDSDLSSLGDPLNPAP